GHQRTHTVIDLLDRRAHGPQHRVAEDPDLASCHQAALARRPSISSAASSRAACRVSGCRLAKTIDPPPAIWVSYGIRTTLLARVRKWASSSLSRTSGLPGVDWFSTMTAPRAS